MGTETPSAGKLIDVPEFDLRTLRRRIKKLELANKKLKEGVQYFSNETDIYLIKSENFLNENEGLLKENGALRQSVKELGEKCDRIETFLKEQKITSEAKSAELLRFINVSSDNIKAMQAHIDNITKEIEVSSSIIQKKNYRIVILRINEKKLKSRLRRSNGMLWFLLTISIIITSIYVVRQMYQNQTVLNNITQFRCVISQYISAISCQR